MSDFNFNSKICTDKVQSERLLALGLKKETSDMVHFFSQSLAQDWTIVPLADGETARYIQGLEIPAWSLHRLIEMADTTTYINEGREDEHELWFCMDKCYCWNNHESFYATDLYDSLINCIEWLIKEGYFNKEYLEE